MWKYLSIIALLCVGVSFPSIAQNNTLALSSFPTIAAMKSIPASAGPAYQRVQVQGYYATGDLSFPEEFFWNASDATADNGGTVINPDGNVGNGRWNLIWKDTLFLKQFGAKEDGSTSDLTPFIKALAVFGATGGKLVLNCGAVTLPSASVAASLAVPNSNFILTSEAPGCAVITITGSSTTNGPLFKVISPSNVWFEDFTLVGNSQGGGSGQTGAILFLGDNTTAGAMNNFGVRRVNLQNFKQDFWVQADNQSAYPMTNFRAEGNKVTSLTGNCTAPNSVNVACTIFGVQGQDGNSSGTIDGVWVNNNYGDLHYVKRLVDFWSGVSNAHAEGNDISNSGQSGSGDGGSYAMMSYDNSAGIGAGGSGPAGIWFVNNTINNPRTSGIYNQGAVDVHDVGNRISGQSDTDMHSIAIGAIALLKSSGVVTENILTNNHFSITVDGFKAGSPTVIGHNTIVSSSDNSAFGIDIEGSSSAGIPGVISLPSNVVEMTGTMSRGLNVYSSSGDPLGTVEVTGGTYQAIRRDVSFAANSADDPFTDANVKMTGVTLSGSVTNEALYAANATGSISLNGVTVDAASFVSGAVGLQFANATDIDLTDILLRNDTLAAGYMIGLGGALGNMSGVKYDLVSSSRRYSAPDFGTVKPTTSATLGSFVQNLNPVEAGSSMSKYVVIGWSNTSGSTTWNDNRVLTGN